ncbi:MAG: ABC transporter ATP-binding protein, partial [Betaproteobacteria bacterium]
TLELLEQLLQDFDGTLFLVSHDRAFLDNVVTQTIAAEGEGRWREYAGGYSDWANWQAARMREMAEAKTEVRQEAKPVEIAKPKGVKLSWKEQRELETLPERIAALEAEQAQVSATLEDPALYQRDPTQAQKSAERLAQIEVELLELLERWEMLESRA